MARLVGELVDEALDLGPIVADYKEVRGYPPYDPRLMVRLLVYGYCTGVRSSRAIERKCVDDVAFRFLAAGQAPDFRSIARFRRRHLAALAGLFLQSLRLAQKLGMVKMGRVALDGTKLEANASRRTCRRSWTGGRSGWPGCRPHARRSRPKPLTVPGLTPRTRNAAAKTAAARTTGRRSPTRAWPLRRPPGRNRRRRPTSPTPNHGS
jgi:transposase